MQNRPLRYQKVLISPDVLKANQEMIKRFLNNSKLKELNPIDYTTLYLLFFIRLRTPKNWLQAKNKHIQQVSESNDSVEKIASGIISFNEFEKEKLKNLHSVDLFSNFHLKGIPESVNRVMIEWYKGNWKLKLIHFIPSSQSLLKLQAQNRRYLTLINDPDKCLDLILGKRDTLSFAIHDLMHADQFFNNPHSKIGQLGFYKFIENIYENINLINLQVKNEQFKNEFDYVVSDMNAYVIHLLKCFKGVFERHHSLDLFDQLLLERNTPENIYAAIKQLGTIHFTSEDELLVKGFFEEKTR